MSYTTAEIVVIMSSVGAWYVLYEVLNNSNLLESRDGSVVFDGDDREDGARISEKGYRFSAPNMSLSYRQLEALRKF